jgi:hypothetical protein
VPLRPETGAPLLTRVNIAAPVSLGLPRLEVLWPLFFEERRARGSRLERVESAVPLPRSPKLKVPTFVW